MGVRQYIGSRYVPIFGRPGEGSILWDNSKPYEPLTIVLYQGNSYTSRQYVPIGIDIHNESFWALTGNYNAQVEQYRQEVRAFDGRITANATAIEEEATARAEADTALQTAIDNEVTARTNADSALQTAIDNEATARAEADTALQTAIDNEVTARTAADTTLQGAINAEATARATAVDTLQTALNTETTARTEADAALDARIDELEPVVLDHMIFIGDSYGTGYQPNAAALTNNIPTLVNRYLAENLTLHNYCVNATGFITLSNGANFATQLQQAIAEAENDGWTSSVKYVVVMGGRNDSASTTNAAESANALFSGIHDAFPTAKVYYAYLWDAYRRPTTNQIINYRTYIEQASLNNVITDALSPSWGLLNRDIFSQNGPYAGDDIHPNQSGASFYAQCLVEMMHGGNGDFARTYVATFDNNITVRRDGFLAVIEGNSMSGTGNADVILATLPACLSFNALCIAIGSGGDAAFWLRCDANSDQYTASFKAIGGHSLGSTTPPGNVGPAFVRTTVHMFS